MSEFFTSLELCAGAGGQALGLEAAGFEHLALFENDEAACNTLRLNRPNWRVEERDLFDHFDFSEFAGADLLAGGLPCPPFSIAGKQLGRNDERNLFDVGVNIADVVRPKAIMFENVRGMMSKRFEEYRSWIDHRLEHMGYRVEWKLLLSSEYGVPQLRPRTLLVAIRQDLADGFCWPESVYPAPTVGDTLYDLMASKGWKGASSWRRRADSIAPTLVGGSKKHGGPDLGPTRAREAWAKLGVNGGSLAESPPEADFSGMPRLTVRMAARIQGFPDEWGIWGKKTSAYRQVGNAFPPPVAKAVGQQIKQALTARQNFVSVASQ
ncbi:MAG: DNA cytosine methyltransferase [Pseudomonadota bacterium]